MASKPQLIVNQNSDGETIRVWQQDDRRWLDFDDGLIQSEIVLDKPEILPSVLNRAMLAGMIFVESPQRILLAGTGGGATARYFAHHFPDVMGDAVEISEQVSSIAKAYFYFPTTENWQLIRDDIVHYVQHCPYRYDLIVVDIAVNQITPHWLVETDFLQQYRTLLTEKGHIAFNLLVDDADEFLHHLRDLRSVFNQQTVCLSLPNYRNTVVLAFNSKSSFLVEEISSRLLELEAEWGLEFKTFYQQMLKDNPKASGVF